MANGNFRTSDGDLMVTQVCASENQNKKQDYRLLEANKLSKEFYFHS